MRTRDTDMVTINGEKFKNDLKKHLPANVCFTDIGKLIGKSEKWFSVAVQRGKVGANNFATICTAYGLDQKDYIIKEKPAAKPKRIITEPDAYDLLLMIEEMNRRINELERRTA